MLTYRDQDVCACDPTHTVATLRVLLTSVSFASLALAITFMSA